MVDNKRRDMTVTKLCENCGKEYHPRHGYQGAARFCGQECFRLYKAKGRTGAVASTIQAPVYEVYKPKPFSPPRGK
jgi:hypothetical protein